MNVSSPPYATDDANDVNDFFVVRLRTDRAFCSTRLCVKASYGLSSRYLKSCHLLIPSDLYLETNSGYEDRHSCQTCMIDLTDQV